MHVTLAETAATISERQPAGTMKEPSDAIYNLAGVRVSDVRGCARIIVDGAVGAAGVAEAMHLAVARHSDPLQITGSLTRLVYWAVRAVTALVGRGIDAVIGVVPPLLEESAPSAGRETAVAILNGVLGDYLADTGNPLAIPMRFRKNGQPLDLEKQALAARLTARGRIALLVHGLCLNDLQWAGQGDDHIEALAARLGYTPLHLHYNSGLHVSTNGRAFSELIETLIAQWPVPVEEIAIVAHSMGGLVARSAYHYGTLAGCDWPDHLRKLVFLGTPHHGSLVERTGNWIDAMLEANSFTAPFARIGKIRSAGVTDLRFGSMQDGDWQGQDRFRRCGDCRQPMPLPECVQCFAIAAVAGMGETVDRLLGDGLVPVDSALGSHDDAGLALAFPESHQWIAHGTGHREMLHRSDVHERIAGWLTS